MNKEKLIEVKDLKTYFYTEGGTAKAVDGVSFDIFKKANLKATANMASVSLTLCETLDKESNSSI